VRLFEVTLFDRRGIPLAVLPYFARKRGEVHAFGQSLRDGTAGAVAFRFEEV
jgi:hypothetical protein